MRSHNDTSSIPSVELTPSQEQNDPMEEDEDDDIPPPTLLSDPSLDLREAREQQAYNHLRNRVCSHTGALDVDLLGRIEWMLNLILFGTP